MRTKLNSKIISYIESILIFFILFIFYSLTSFSYPDWLDSPEFVTSSSRLGIFHPPGSPVAVFLGYLFSKVPILFGTYSLLIFSPFFAAFGVLTLHRSMTLLVDQTDLKQNAITKIAVIIFTISIGLFPGLWMQAQRCEVYTLGFFVSCLMFYQLIVLYLKDSDSKISFYLFTFLTGISFGIHPLIGIASATAILPYFIQNLINKSFYITLTKSMLFGFLGCVPLIAIPLFVNNEIDLRWGNLNSFQTWFDFVTGKSFLNTFIQSSSQSVMDRLMFTIILIFDTLGTFGSLMILASGIFLIKFKSKFLIPSAIVFIATSTTLIAQKQVILSNPDSIGYLLPMVSIGAIIVFLAILKLSKKDDPIQSVQIFATFLFIAAACIAIPSLKTLNKNLNLSCTSGKYFATSHLENLPPNSVLVLSDFALLFMTEYLQQVENVRPDITTIYLKDLKRKSISQILQEKGSPFANGSFPELIHDKLTFPNFFPDVPVAFDIGPQIGKVPLNQVSSVGFLWVWDKFQIPDNEKLLNFNSKCDQETKDKRFSNIISWHGLWSSQIARFKGDLSKSEKLIKASFCENKEDNMVLGQMQKWSMAIPECP